MRVAEVSEEQTLQTLADLLSDGVFIDGDWVESKDQDPDGKVRLIQLADVGDGVFRDRSARFLTMEKARELRCTFLEPGDVLVARMPEPLGRACIFPGVGRPAVTVVDVCILRPNAERARSEWLVKAINSPAFRESMQEFVRGTTRQRISRKNLGTLRLSTPAVSEQLALADLVDRVDLKRGVAKDHVLTASKAIERFRQAVLTAACSGRLTAEWRTESGVGDDVSGDLPAGWNQHTLDDLGKWRTGGTPSRQRSEYFGGGIPWVKSGDLRDGRITATDETLTPEALENSAAKLMPVGTVSIALYGATIGRLGVFEIEAATNQACANCVPDSAIVDPWFLFYYLLGQRPRLVAAGQGGAQPNLTNQIVRDWPIELPPINEQKEIVRLLDQLLVTADELARRIKSATHAIDRSSQAALAKAFRGELVPMERTRHES